jgi:DNA invertase Pin-like site-specific DNA recombinase
LERKIKVVAIYVRKSRENNDSLEGQLASIIEYCEKMGWDYEVFEEKGSASSEDWDRPELQRMLKLIAKQHYDAVVCTEQSRITRADEFYQFRNILQEANCLFITTQTNSVYDYNKPEDEFMSDILSAVAKQEIAFAKLRLKRGTIQSAKAGNWLGKKIPIGYTYNKETKRLEPSEDAPVIQRMFKLYMEGMSTKDIAFKFTHEGVITSIGFIWSPAGVARLLNNIVYVGHSLYGRTTQKKVNGKRVTKQTSEDEQIFVENTHESIISQEDWDCTQDILRKRNSRPPKLRLGKRTFSGLIRCSLCGAIHSFQMANGKRRINSCQTRHYNEDMSTYKMCANGSVKLDHFETLFYLEMEEYTKHLEEHVSAIQDAETDNHDSTKESEIDSKKKQLHKISQSVKRVQQGFVMEIFTEAEAKQQIKLLKEQEEYIRKELLKLEQENSSEVDYVGEVLNRMKEFLSGKDNLSEREKNEILRDFIEVIMYEKTGDDINIEIHWKDFT